MKAPDDATVARLQRILDTPDLGDGRYELGERIGEGGMGVVHVGLDRRLDREVAIKFLRPGALAASDVARLRREALLLARLEHPGIVPVHDLGELPDGGVFLVMKRVRGRGLDAVVQGGVPLGERLRLFLQLADTIAFAHAAGVLHRDLKPANVMVGTFGEVLAMDWGVARVVAGSDATTETRSATPSEGSPPGTGAGTVIGTPGWMAPEQARGDAISSGVRMDVFGLGRMLGMLLEAPGPAGAAARTPPAPLRSIARRATAEAPADRYPDVPEMAADVRRFLDGERVLAHLETPAERIRRVLAPHTIAIVLIGAYVLVRALLFAINRR